MTRVQAMAVGQLAALLVAIPAWLLALSVVHAKASEPHTVPPVHVDTQPQIIPACAVHHTVVLSDADFFEVQLMPTDSVCSARVDVTIRRPK